MDLQEVMDHKDNNKEDEDLKDNNKEDGDLKVNHHKEIMVHKDMDQAHNKELGDLKVVGVQDHNKVGVLNLLHNLKEHPLKNQLNQKFQQN